MANKTTRRENIRKASVQILSWGRFDEKRTRDTGGNPAILHRNLVSISIAAGSSHYEEVEQIASAANEPVPVASISKLLDGKRSLRGTVYLGDVGSEIDKIVRNYAGMRWWMEKNGLVIDVAPHNANSLSEFDRMAGKLAYDGTVDGKLSTAVVSKIAAELDAAGFLLLENLQPAQRKTVCEFNQKYARSAVKTFAAAAVHKRFSRTVRRRLYVARDRYKAAVSGVEACPRAHAGHFSEDF